MSDEGSRDSDAPLWARRRVAVRGVEPPGSRFTLASSALLASDGPALGQTWTQHYLNRSIPPPSRTVTQVFRICRMPGEFFRSNFLGKGRIYWEIRCVYPGLIRPVVSRRLTPRPRISII